VKLRTWTLAALVALGIAGCGSSKPGQLAEERAAQGAPCEAAELHEGSEAQQTKVAQECTTQKNRDAATKEAKQEDEDIREGERLKAEGKED
jgi:uncharacterized protein YcfL